VELFLQRSDATNSGDLTLAEFVEYLKQHEKNLGLCLQHWIQIRMVE